tara:strand:- start:12623 stop:13354 length:732 start_codon:yes stop_codon:yes gene_type:complete
MNLEFEKKIIHLKDVNSTNEFANKYIDENKIQESFVITADYQKCGKGQVNNRWDSEKEKNLLISVVFSYKKNISNQFDFNIISSLAVLDILQELKVEKAKVKWPNDILINKKKVAGILIKNKIKGNEIYKSIIGLGLNVNQEVFRKFNRKATSLKIEKSKLFDLIDIRDNFLKTLKSRLSKNINKNYIDYNNSLYLKDTISTFEINGEKKVGIIKSVNKKGFLSLETENGIEVFRMKEISFLS